MTFAVTVDDPIPTGVAEIANQAFIDGKPSCGDPNGCAPDCDVTDSCPPTTIPTSALSSIKNVLDAVILMVGMATILALALVLALSLRLRQGEIQTIFKLGCSRTTIARLLGAEIAIILAVAALLTALLITVVAHFDEPLVRTLFIR